jgi:hypothetical protein
MSPNLKFEDVRRITRSQVVSYISANKGQYDHARGKINAEGYAKGVSDALYMTGEVSQTEHKLLQAELVGVVASHYQD